MLKYGRILRAVCEEPWAILPERMADIIDVLAFQASGGKLTDDEIRAYVDADKDEPRAADGPESQGGSVAVLPFHGIVHHRIEQVQQISGPGGVSTEAFNRRLRQAMNDQRVSGVVIDIRSPGGGVFGVDELAADIRRMRGGDKPIVAVANAYAGSAAYYVAAQADELVVTTSGEVGSIGVFTVHENMAAALESMGVDVTLVSAGRFKVEANPFEPLSDDAREAIQSRVDDYYDAFVKAVAAGRGTTAARVRGGFGEGRMVGARDAVEMGMADRIGTLDETVARLMPRRRSVRQARRALAFR